MSVLSEKDLTAAAVIIIAIAIGIGLAIPFVWDLIKPVLHAITA